MLPGSKEYELYNDLLKAKQAAILSKNTEGVKVGDKIEVPGYKIILDTPGLVKFCQNWGMLNPELIGQIKNGGMQVVQGSGDKSYLMRHDIAENAVYVFPLSVNEKVFKMPEIGHIAKKFAAGKLEESIAGVLSGGTMIPLNKVKTLEGKLKQALEVGEIHDEVFGKMEEEPITVGVDLAAVDEKTVDLMVKVDLKDASELGQKVKGTSEHSEYRVFGVGDVKFAARINKKPGGACYAVSVRAEGKLAPYLPGLEACGFSNKGGYASQHVECKDGLEVARYLGAIVLGSGVSLEKAISHEGLSKWL